MKRLSYGDLKASYDSEYRNGALLAAALNLALHSKPDATEKCPFDGGHYTFQLYGCNRAHGGIVIETWRCKGQTPHSAARYLDDYRRPGMVSSPEFEYAAAINRLRAARNRLGEVA